MTGYRTYAVAAIMIGLVLAKGYGFMDPKMYEEIQAILVGLGLVTLRAGIKNDTKV